jgi:hypothetical protein
MQIVCAVLAAGLTAAGFLFDGPLLTVRTPLFSFQVEFGIAAFIVLMVPGIIHRERRKKRRAEMLICHRCEKALLAEPFAFFCGEPVCEECAKFLEKIEGHKLKRYTKGRPDHAHA